MSTNRLRLLPFLIVALALACATEPAEVVRAREVLSATIEAESDYHMYAISMMADSPAPHARAMMRDAIAGENLVEAAAAIRELPVPADPSYAAALATAFGRRGLVKAGAAAQLVHQGDAAAAEWLLEELGRSGMVLPTPAMVALVEAGHEDAVRESIEGLVGSEDVSTRNEGYAILAALKRPWATQRIAAGLKKEFGEERAGAITALGNTGDPSVAVAVRPWVRTQGLVLASLEALGNLGNADALGDVERMLDHEQPLVRAYAAVAAWKLGGSDAAREALEPLLDAEDPSVRAALAVQLASAQGPEADAWLVRLAEDSDKGVRVEAYRGLRGREGAQVVAQLAQGAQDGAYDVASVAISELAEVGDASHVEALVPLMDSENPYLALSAAHAVLSLAEGQAAAKVD